VKQIGEWFISQKFDTALPSDQPLPTQLLRRHELSGQAPFLAKVLTGSDLESHFPATVQLIRLTEGRYDLRLDILPVHYGAFERAKHEKLSDSYLALAAAAASAPQFLSELEGGLSTQLCGTRNKNVSAITPDHATPLASVFDAFNGRSDTLDGLKKVTGNNQISLRDAAHLHGQKHPNVREVARPAGRSGIASGLSVRTITRQALLQKVPIHIIQIQTKVDVNGQTCILSLDDSMLKSMRDIPELALISAALGFTHQVVDRPERESMISRLFEPSGDVDRPISEVILG